jgi:hypothetical protein
VRLLERLGHLSTEFTKARFVPQFVLTRVGELDGDISDDAPGAS